MITPKRKEILSKNNIGWTDISHLNFLFRFSLLLLEPGEIYFEDFSVFYYPSGLPEEEAIKRYNLIDYK